MEWFYVNVAEWLIAIIYVYIQQQQMPHNIDVMMKQLKKYHTDVFVYT